MSFHTSRGPRVVSNGVKIRMNYSTVHARLDEAVSLFTALIRAFDAAACATLAGGSPHLFHLDDTSKNWGKLDGIDIPPPTMSAFMATYETPPWDFSELRTRRTEP
jgi:hypothetical protein